TLLRALCLFFFQRYHHHPALHLFPTRRSSDLRHHEQQRERWCHHLRDGVEHGSEFGRRGEELEHPDHHERNRQVCGGRRRRGPRSEEHTSELQSPDHLVCRLLLEKKKRRAPLS